MILSGQNNNENLIDMVSYFLLCRNCIYFLDEFHLGLIQKHDLLVFFNMVNPTIYFDFRFWAPFLNNQLPIRRVQNGTLFDWEQKLNICGSLIWWLFPCILNLFVPLSLCSTFGLKWYLFLYFINYWILIYAVDNHVFSFIWKFLRYSNWTTSQTVLMMSLDEIKVSQKMINQFWSCPRRIAFVGLWCNFTSTRYYKKPSVP